MPEVRALICLTINRKRKREDDRAADSASIVEYVKHLETAVDQPSETKLKLLRDLRKSAAGARHELHQVVSAASKEVFTCLAHIVEDAEEHVAIEATYLIKDIISSEVDCSKRLAFGLRLDQVKWNPFQDDVFDHQLLLRALFGALTCGNPEKEAVAEECLLSACLYNQHNTTRYVRLLTGQVLLGKSHRLWGKLVSAMEHLPDRLSGEIEVEVDQLILPALSTMQGSRGDEEQLPATEVLALIVEKRPAAAEFIIRKGGLIKAARLLADGDLACKDAAVHLLWLLLKGRQRLLGGWQWLLPAPGPLLAGALKEVITHSSDNELVRSKSMVPTPQVTVAPLVVHCQISSTSNNQGRTIAEENSSYRCSNGDEATDLLESLIHVDPLFEKLEDEERLEFGSTTCQTV